MLTTSEVCAQLRIGIKTLRRMIREGEIEATKVGAGRWGGTYRFSEEAVADYLKRNVVKASA